MKKTFSIQKLFNDSWEDYKSNWKLFIFVGIILLLVHSLGSLGVSYDSYGGFTQSAFMQILALVVQSFVVLGLIKFLLNIVDGKEHKIEDLFQGTRSISHLVSYIVVSFIYTILIIAGGFLFLVPGIIAAVGFVFSTYLVAEEKTGIFESFTESWSLMHGQWFKVIALFIILMLFNLLGFLALFVGLLVTIPMTHLIFVRLYRTLQDTELVTSEEGDMQVVDILEGDQSFDEE